MRTFVAALLSYFVNHVKGVLMPHLASFRTGWQNENLARYILSRFCFIANPSTISDDIGSDFFCTLFQVQKEDRYEFLVPRSSFAIQVKSSPEDVDVTNKIDYLWNLEIPYFVGVIKHEKLSMTIFSGEHLPEFIASKSPKKLKLKLCGGETEAPIFDQVENETFSLRFPKLIDISADSSYEELSEKSNHLLERCRFIQSNIATRRNCEYIFPRFGSDYATIIAGKDSSKTFRKNFLMRLAESFYNLNWIYENRNDQFSEKEFETFEAILLQLKELYSKDSRSFFDSMIAPIYHTLKSKIR